MVRVKSGKMKKVSETEISVMTKGDQEMLSGNYLSDAICNTRKPFGSQGSAPDPAG